VNARRSIENVNEAIASDRRKFIQGVGIAVLTVQCLPLIAHAAGNPPDLEEAGDNLIIQSGPGLLHHVHNLLIPYALLKAPPLQGVQLTSTQAMLHRHNIALTQKELTIVNQGGTVTQKASSHHFVIALAKGKDHSQAGSRSQSRERE
jgi:hypothetical protein